MDKPVSVRRWFIVLILFVLFFVFWIVMWTNRDKSGWKETFTAPSGYFPITWQQPAASGDWDMSAMSYSIYVFLCGTTPNPSKSAPGCDSSCVVPPGPPFPPDLVFADTVYASAGKPDEKGVKTFTWKLEDRPTVTFSWNNAYKILVVPFLNGTEYAGTPACISKFFYQPGSLSFSDNVVYYLSDGSPTAIQAGYSLLNPFSVKITTNPPITNNVDGSNMISSLRMMLEMACNGGYLTLKMTPPSAVGPSAPPEFATYNHKDYMKDGFSPKCYIGLSVGVVGFIGTDIVATFNVNASQDSACYAPGQPLAKYKDYAGLRWASIVRPGYTVKVDIDMPGFYNEGVPIVASLNYNILGGGTIGAPVGLTVGNFVPSSGTTSPDFVFSSGTKKKKTSSGCVIL